MLSNISFDIDGMWSALELHDIYSDPKKDAGIEQGLPKILVLLSELGIKATFFVVGRNVENYPKEHKAVLKDGHIVGNHSYSHNHKMRCLSYPKIKEDIELAHNIIVERLGIRPEHFRAPTYSYNRHAFRVLHDLGYRYDSSFMPAYFPGITPLSAMFLRRRPHRIGGIYEIPLSVNIFPPFYVNGTALLALGMGWLKFTMKLLKLQGLPLVINFHDVDVIESPDVINRHRRRSHKNSLPLVRSILAYIKKKAEITSMDKIAERYC